MVQNAGSKLKFRQKPRYERVKRVAFYLLFDQSFRLNDAKIKTIL